jgi:predicted HicB family RNase H-like nuclease
MKILNYRGYLATIEFDADDLIFVGRVAGLNDVVGFHADTVDGLIEAFHEAVDDYLETCAELGKEPEKSYSGKVMLRVKPELHSRIAVAAEMAGLSINQWGEQVLSQALPESSFAHSPPRRQSSKHKEELAIT